MTPRIGFVFAARAIGGAERSMLRLIAAAHPATFDCRVIVMGPENTPFRSAAAAIPVPYHGMGGTDLRGLLALLRGERLDVLYLFGRFRTIPWALLARRAGVPCIVAAERSAATRRSDWLARRLDRHLVDAYASNSRSAAAKIRRVVGPNGPPVFVVPNGVEMTSVGREASASSRDAASLLCVGNISPNKGQRTLLEAVRLLQRQIPTLRARLVGRDFTRGRFFEDARAAGLENTYSFAGFVDDVAPLYARAAVAVLPTVSREGMPTSILEAMSAGVPVVASDVGGVGEVVENDGTGLLVPPGDAAALAAAVGRLLADPELRARLAASARRRVLEHHSVAAMVSSHRTLFAEALGRKRSSALESPASVAHVTTAAVSLRYLLLNQLATLKSRGYDVTGISSAGPAAAALSEHGIPHEPVAMSRRITPIADLVALLRLQRLMRRSAFTIVHAHNPKPGLLAQMAARLAGVPVVVNTVHGFYFHERTRPLVRRFYVWIETLAARFSDRILFQNAEDADTALREGIAPAHKIRVLGNGIDLERFDRARLAPRARDEIRRTFGIPDHAPVIGFVGRLVAEKGVLDLIEAVRQLRLNNPDLRVLLVGGADREKADSLTHLTAGFAPVQDVCVFAGHREDMPEVYSAMDIFVLPSYREGFPRAAMEACAMGLPCVVTNIRGCRQVVADGRNGILTPVGQPTALAEAVRSLLEDPARARRLGEESQRRARLEFDERRVFGIVLDEYERLLRAKGRGGRVPAATLSDGVLREDLVHAGTR